MIRASCGEHIPHLLRAYGVATVFGMPGVHSLEFYRSLEAAGISHVGVRHEQGAGFMADGYARATGRPGVAMIISGPGVTNAATAIGQAYSDSSPVLLLSAAIAVGAMGMDRGMLHEISDQRALTAPITGLSMVTLTPDQLPEQIARAFSRFASQRLRPVHLAVPVDILEAPLDHHRNARRMPARPGPAPEVLARVAALLGSARRPLIIAGGGATDAAQPLKNLVEKSGALFVSTVAGKGILPDSHPLSLGATLQRPATRQAIADADFVLAIGTEIAEPDLYVTADAEAAGPTDPALLGSTLTLTGQFVRVDIDPDVAVRDYDPVEVMVADAKLTAIELSRLLPDASASLREAGSRAEHIRQRNRDARSPLERKHDSVLMALRRALPEDALVYADMTQIAYTGCITFPVERPRCWHFPMGFGTLGFALPAAIGGKLGCPGRAVVAIVGDGGFQFTLTELATAVERELAIAIILWDNDALGEIADFMNAREIPTVDVYPENPDFELFARAYRCGYESVSSPDEIERAVRSALCAKGPTLIHIRQEKVATDGA